MDRELAEKVIRANLPEATADYVLKNELCLVGIRGRGVSGNENQRGKFNDELAWISPTLFSCHRANVDPSSYRAGVGSGSSKGMATLKPGVWRYCTGLHKGLYAAFRQYAPVKIWRDGFKNLYSDILNQTINIHEGSRWGGTSSAGCQTLPYGAPWKAFKEQGYSELAKYKQKWFYYILVDQDDLDKGIFKVPNQGDSNAA